MTQAGEVQLVQVTVGQSCLHCRGRELRLGVLKLRLNGIVWSVVTCLFVDDTVLLAESVGDLQRVVNEFYNVCKRRKMKVNAEKSKVMVFQRREGEVIAFNVVSDHNMLVVECNLYGRNERKVKNEKRK